MSKDKKLGLFKELFGLYAIAGGAKLTTASFDKLYDAVDNTTGKIREFSNLEIQNVKIELQKTGFDANEIGVAMQTVAPMTAGGPRNGAFTRLRPRSHRRSLPA